MFNDCPLLAMIETKKNNIVVMRICEDYESQKTIDKVFSDAAECLYKDKAYVLFDGKYTPQSEDMEILVIPHFHLPTIVKDALKNPHGLEVYSPKDGKLSPIKALFIGKCSDENNTETYTVAFQKFRNDQYITATRHNLFFTGSTFVKDNRIGITVANSVDCVIKEDNLYFQSYYFAKQIFDLTGYYREASSQDVQAFVDSDLISIENSKAFVDTANTWERRKIASINDSGILKNYTARRIKAIGDKTGVAITIVGDSIVLPENREERRIVLGFLDEEVYTGAFSQTLFQTNSKRKAK